MATLANWPVFTESNGGGAQIEACAPMCGPVRATEWKQDSIWR